VDRGHPISQLVPLGLEELERLAGGGSSARTTNVSAAALLEEFLDAVQAFDAARAEQLLERAELALSARDFVVEMLSPLLARVGDAWAKGALCTASEHIASALIRDRAGNLLRRLGRDPGAPIVIVTTPAGEHHELGALLAAIAARMQGYNVVYLGPDLPAAEIARAAEGVRAELVALSVLVLDPKDAEVEIRTLVRELPEGIDVVVGGAGAYGLSELIPSITTPATLEEFERFLAARRERPGAAPALAEG
jgi:methanogenic corrinoid protein MtbC1